ncbi:Addiction module toxin, RelE/StbE family [[Clostridium] ultunense Esp]|nr:Addiction module toxin, RelE/StbE family [[Clostridium] ultunense Esp]
MKLILSRAARDYLESLPSKPFRQIVTAIFRLLSEPYPHDAKRLKGYPYSRIDVGEYRVVYEVKNEEVRILIVGKRNDDEVHRLLKRH